MEAVAEAIRALRVRGAPLIGIAAAMGVALARGVSGSAAGGCGAACESDRAGRVLGATRPTAVNLHWALDRMQRRAAGPAPPARISGDALIAEATAIWDEDRAMCRRIGEQGAALIRRRATVLTHLQRRRARDRWHRDGARAGVHAAPRRVGRLTWSPTRRGPCSRAAGSPHGS